MSDITSTYTPTDTTLPKAKTPDEIQAEIQAALAGFTQAAPASKKSEAQLYREAVAQQVEQTFSSFVPAVAGFFTTIRTERPDKVLSALKGLDTAKRALLKAVYEISDAAHAEAMAPVAAVDAPQESPRHEAVVNADTEPMYAADQADEFDRQALQA